MVMGLVLVSVVTGLSLLGDESTATSLSPQQRQFLRQWLAKNQKNASQQQLSVAWQPPAADHGRQLICLARPAAGSMHGGLYVLLLFLIYFSQFLSDQLLVSRNLRDQSSRR